MLYITGMQSKTGEPQLLGPYFTEEERIRDAKGILADFPQEQIFKLDIDCDVAGQVENVQVSAFLNTEID